MSVLRFFFVILRGNFIGMTITELQQQYAAHPNMAVMKRLLKDTSVQTVFCGGLCASAASLFSSVLVQEGGCPFVFILGDLEEAGYFYHDLTQILGTEKVLFFPSSFRRSIKYGQKDAANEILRTEVLSRLQKGEEGLCIVTYPDALAEKVVSRKELSDKTLKLNVGEKVDTTFITDVLHSYGFEYVDYVYEPGQYAVRGSIIDVFSFASEYPYRIDFFGDEVESIRTFEVESQLSREKKSGVSIVPDLAVTGDVTTSFLDFIPKDTTLAMRDFLWLRERIQVVHDEALTPQAIAVQEAAENGGITLEGKLIDGSEFTVRALDFRRLEFGNKPTGTPNASVTFNTSAQPIFHKNFDLVASSFKDYLEKGYSLYICSDSMKQTDRIKAIFEDRGDQINFTPVERTIHEGFVDNTLRLCIFTDHQLFDRFHKYNLKSDKARSGKVALSLKELNQFTPGDYVVHTDHGIGRFSGLVRIPNGDTTQEVLKLVFQNEDVVFVSIHSLHKVSKYKGKEGEAPRLNKLGTGAWEKLKERTKSKIKDIARDLIKLYSQRRQEKGFSYSPDSFLQRELEASFIYEDTPDQSKATIDVKADMESDRPMDRLVCGDVGFGKTEVAIRAAFKAVQESKQVVYLVPTTILAQQHYRTFVQRMKDFPVRIDLMCRFRTPAQQKKTVEDAKKGLVDIIIGTHRVLSEDMKFKDLGLLIIDEEQRFGVQHKEKIKKLKENVDVLTLTATPIPRTLHMSLIGIRDMSVLEEAPNDRMPIQTYVMEYNDEMVREAIERECARQGQVYYVYNRVEDIDEVAGHVQKLVPDLTVAYAHGQMREHELERIMYDFINGEIDVLVSTTIIETGLDISNANTMIIHDADRLGLSQLYQLRGRVGRSNRMAYAFLLYRRDKMLKEVAEKRLAAIREFTDLGSGFKIAMRDLEIRGAGNLLGAEQHGHMEAVGYDLYCKMLNEAVKQLKGEMEEEETFTTTMDLNVDAFIPASYIPNEYQKLDVYKRIAAIENREEMEDMTEELIDRFGDIPKKVEKLLEVAALKAQAHQLYVTAVEQKGEVYTFTMYEKAKVHPERIPKLIEDFRGELTFKADGVQPCFIYEKKRRNLKEKQTDALESTKNVLNGLKRLIGEEKSGIIDPLSK